MTELRSCLTLLRNSFERLEPRAVKVASAVLRGLEGSNAPWLPDQPTPPATARLNTAISPLLSWHWWIL